ncbi:MAG: hypothetical protein ACRCZF_22220, partial [Gemmataceae bacterium]
LYAIPGVNIMFWLAYCLTDQVLEAYHFAERYRALVMFGILSAVVGVILYRLFTSRTIVTTGSPAEVPIYNKPVEKVTEATEMAVEKAIKMTIDKVVQRGAGAGGEKNSPSEGKMPGLESSPPNKLES